MERQVSSNLGTNELLGVWQRESISIDGRAPYEDSNVLWLHAGDYFADIRWPRSAKGTELTSAFAGKALWEPPRMRFSHEIDLKKQLDEDIGCLSLLNDQLIEHGKVSIGDKVIRFQEVWSRITKSTLEHCRVAYKSSARGTGYIVWVGDHVIAMEETDEKFSSAAWTHDHISGWVLTIGLGDKQRLDGLLHSFVAGSLATPWAECGLS
jgi:hypothetical protein